MKKDEISVDDVADFKDYCDENGIIISIIKKQLQKYFISPILDVGFGTGDIAYHSLFDKKVIGIDINMVSIDKFPLSKNHIRLESDFFEYNSKKQINTILISHTLQFIQSDEKKLNAKIRQINPKNIILVVNKNNDFMGKMINWVDKHCLQAFPERRVKGIIGYKQIKTVPFIAKLVCENFKLLAEQMSYLMHTDITNKEKEVIQFLEKNLKQPEFTINQEIVVYEKR